MYISKKDIFYTMCLIRHIRENYYISTELDNQLKDLYCFFLDKFK